MGLEIEKKYLVNGNAWKEGAKGESYRQGYVSSHRDRTVRVRTAGDKAFLTIKGTTQGATRREYEYEIPYADALEMLREICEKPIIEKVRYKIRYQGLLWEVDEFSGENQGLVVAEVELTSEDQPIDLPPWIGREVTGDETDTHANLIHHPYSKWG